MVLVTRPVIVVGRARPLGGIAGEVEADGDPDDEDGVPEEEGMLEDPTPEPASDPSAPHPPRRATAQSALTAYTLVREARTVGMVMNLRRDGR
ncbi:hypothetical protein ACOCJ4_11020 [Knoellia sp. CPCC 206435]|uniref:hypothetical protein n=1 Tax=Knoellia terrae TaxID=3404797 RepID=UPI003B43500D